MDRNLNLNLDHNLDLDSKHLVGKPAASRPGSTPEFGRPANRPAVSRELQAVLRDLALTRGRLEDLRREDGPYLSRVELLSVLHDLRAEAAQARIEV